MTSADLVTDRIIVKESEKHKGFVKKHMSTGIS